MAVNHGMDVRPRAVDLAMDEAFEIGGPAVRRDRLSVQVELDHVGCPHQRRRHAAGEQEPVGSSGMTDADMAETVDHVLVEQDVIGVDQVLDQRRQPIASRSSKNDHSSLPNDWAPLRNQYRG